MRPTILLLASCLLFVGLLRTAQGHGATPAPPLGSKVVIGNFQQSMPGGIAFIKDNAAGIVLNVGWPSDKRPGASAPDESINHVVFQQNGATIHFDWGRLGAEAAGARLTTDKPVTLTLTLPRSPWHHFNAIFNSVPGGLDATAITGDGRFFPWHLRVSPAPDNDTARYDPQASLTVSLTPTQPVVLVAGYDVLPPLSSVTKTLDAASARYAARRAQAHGDWGDFLGAIADNMNNARTYSTLDNRVGQPVSRTWSSDPDYAPYFGWDSFFTALLTSLEDPAQAHQTVLGILSYETPEGMVPNDAHWTNDHDGVMSIDHSQPPVASLCVWKIQQRWPDRAFLAAVYPKLVKWHDWWPRYSSGRHDGMLQWGSATGDFQEARYACGWDDTPEYDASVIPMVGTQMAADAVDLNALWSMDAEYLAKIATALGRTQDARRFLAEHAAMNARINKYLWNDRLGVWCSRLWNVPPKRLTPLPPSAFPGGFEAAFYNDETLTHAAAQRHDDALVFDWKGQSPITGVSGEHWSARWRGTFVAPATGLYRFAVTADDGDRLFIGGKPIIDDWSVHATQEDNADISLAAGAHVPVTLEYFQHEFNSSVKLVVSSEIPGSPQDAFLTRLTPMNFYPLICGAATPAQARLALATLYRNDKFWGKYPLPTLPYDDPQWPQQTYWKGHTWAPVNYLMWQGIRRYCDPAHQADFVRKSVSLFMGDWTSKGQCCENFNSTDGSDGGDPHYTWGALMCEIGLESLYDIGPTGRPVPAQGTGITDNITLDNVPAGGRLYRVATRNGHVQMMPEKQTAAFSR
jgi:glycogen debranching enzyme